ncbi:unnamed protein product, partial [Rotaria sp. Silwood1]
TTTTTTMMTTTAVYWFPGPKGLSGADGIPGLPGSPGPVGIIQDTGDMENVESIARHREEDIRTMIQRHLLTHIYNPSQFVRGRTPLVSSAPYIPYAQLSAGMPGQCKQIFERVV